MISRLWQLLEQRAEEDSSRVLVASRERSIRRGELARTSDALAAGLADVGVGRNARIAVMSRDRLEHLELAFAANRLGASFVPLNPLYRGELIDNALWTVEPDVVVVDSECAEHIVPRAEHIKKWVTLDEPLTPSTGVEAIPYQTLVDTNSEISSVVGDGMDESMVLFTSGTTGPSKGVSMSDRFLLEVAATNARVREVNSDSRLYSCFSFCHAGPIGYTLLPALIGDASMAWAPSFSASEFWSDVRSLEATQFAMFSATIIMLLSQPTSDLDRGHGAAICFAVGSPRAQEFEQRFGVRIVEGYGLSECGALAYQWAEARKLGSCGRPAPGWTLEIHDEDERPLKPGATGEIVARPSRAGLLMNGYTNRPEATLETYRNLWFHTGDLGFFDDEGCLWFVGRKKDAIRRRGENISAWEVEQAIIGTGFVQECAAYGVPSELGEEEVAVAVVTETEPLDPEALLLELENRLPSYCIPTYVRVMAELPRTPTGKIKKYVLEQQGTDAAWRRQVDASGDPKNQAK